jgi:DNA-binding winged helix-turn-helix (wHTH) protein
VTIPLGSRALCVLVEHQGALVSRQEITDAVWPGTTVEDNNLGCRSRRCVACWTKDGRTAVASRTVPGRGYRFVVPIGGNNAVQHARAEQPDDADGDIVTAAPETKAPAPYRGRRGRLVALLLTGAGLILSAVLLFESGFGGRRVIPPLSLVVLPFENLTGDPKDDYLVEGITEDITTDLSKVRGMFVIARASAYALQGKPIDVRKKMQALTKGSLSTPIVAVGWNVERFDGRNLSLRLVALGYTNVYWYRGGREAWEVAGLPETPIGIQDW